MKVRPDLMLYCQHSLGLGHLKRSWALAERLSSEFQVTLVSGGAPPGDLAAPKSIDVIELPPLAQDADGQLVVLKGADSLEDVRRERTRLLVQTYLQVRPAVVVMHSAGAVAVVLPYRPPWPRGATASPPGGRSLTP